MIICFQSRDHAIAILDRAGNEGAIDVSVEDDDIAFGDDLLTIPFNHDHDGPQAPNPLCQ